MRKSMLYLGVMVLIVFKASNFDSPNILYLELFEFVYELKRFVGSK